MTRKNQRALKARELEEARLQRLRDDRIKAYADFARLTYTYKATEPAAIVDVLAAYSAIELLSESAETKEVADKLRDKIIELRKIEGVAWEEKEGKTTTADERIALANKQLHEAREVFLSKAKDELGIKQL